MGRLEGKVIVVTGASRGIALAIAREGAQLVLAARDRKALGRARDGILGGASAVVGDVTRPADVDCLFRVVRRRYGRLDVLVNNAGVFTYKPFVRTTLRDWRADIEANLTALFLTTRAALPLLERSDPPHLINVLWVSSRQAFPNCSAYCASKFGALGLTQVLRGELRSKMIRVTVILPGSTDTRMAKPFDFPVDRTKLVQPADVAEAVLGALGQPPRATVEEVVIMPSSGRL